MKLVCALTLAIGIALTHIAPAPAPAPPTRAPYTYLPLAGTPLFDGTADGTNCLALWPLLSTHPHWSLSLLDTEWTVREGLLRRDSIRIEQDGEVWLEPTDSWQAGPRVFYLTESEVREIRGLDRLACRERTARHDHAHTYYVTYATAVGDDLQNAAPIPADSDMGAVISRIVRDANARYVAAVAEDAQRLELDLIVPRSQIPYRIHVARAVLTLTSGATELYRHPLTADELADIADWNLDGMWDGGWVSDDGWARGTLRRDGRGEGERIVFDSVQLSWAFPDLGDVLTRVIDADCARRCSMATSSSWTPPRLIPP